jgi:hypothetical protein
MATTPPFESYASRTNYKFHKEDLSRAIFCARVVSHKDDAGAEEFLVKRQQKHPGIQFEKLHMSLDCGDKEQKFLVAYANDATFIAFRGTTTLQDATETFQFDEYFKRHFHNEFLKRSAVFDVGMGPYQPLVELLHKPGRRIILCGHADGGAVSHMILLSFLLYYGEWDRVSRHLSFKLAIVHIGEAFSELHLVVTRKLSLIDGVYSYLMNRYCRVSPSLPIRLLHSHSSCNWSRNWSTCCEMFAEQNCLEKYTRKFL